MKRNFLIIAILAFHCFLFSQEETHNKKDNPLSFLEDMIGKWYYHPDERILQSNPDLKDLIVKQFEWADNRKKFMNFYEGVIDENLQVAVLTCQIAINPVSGIVQFQGYQARNDFYYYGRYEPLEEGKGFTWIYDVYYPENMKFDNEIDKKRGFITYRSMCRMKDDDSMGCKTDQLVLGVWKPFFRTEEVRYVRR